MDVSDYSETPVKNSTTTVTYPDCKCQRCGSIFRDPYEIFPGPTLCPSCVADEREQQRKMRRAKRRIERY
jgi:predicted Zn-ribbon and HTH transcriptional regulator